ncbi:acyl-CoA thioesterase [Mangrovimonas aestuarii]|uniref:acyl-CoA thioesterase n=1 Tax=Mangrovimonas aestuarii TaxID=3018443 RepID=UPI00237894E1|nr:thioesterase family protein [Mangrovimonas aestuarii]
MKFDEMQTRVRYAETDQMGVVHHANYALYLEMGRTEWLRNKGVSYREMEEKGVMLPVVSMNLKYKRSAQYDELLTVRTKLAKLPTASIEFYYEIVNKSGQILCTANTVLAFVDMKTNKLMRAPKFLMDLIEAEKITES